MTVESPIDPKLRIASAHLAVGDLSRSVDFYERILGLPLISRGEDGALLGPDRDEPLLNLTALAHPTPPAAGSTGLFHVALLHPTRADLAATVLRIVESRWPLDGASDHGVSEALYLSDPDGLGLEIYVDRPRERWERSATGPGVRMYTLPLDIDDLLAQAEAGSTPQIAAGTGIGHVHLKASDVGRSVDFYRDVLGLEEQARLPAAGFLSAGGYHHHVGLNSWQSQGGVRGPDSSPGLRLVEFRLSAPAELEALERRVADRGRVLGRPDDLKRPTEESEERLVIHDPDGEPLSFALGVA